MTRRIPEPEWWMPSAWPLWYRRAFFLTLPISGPIWLCAVIAGAMVMMVFGLAVALPGLLFLYLKDELWDARANELQRDDVGTGKD